jgi:hypothetical protein
MRSRFRPSPAMIVACIALFVALGGTATAVTYVVSSNSQIGPGTISGNNPPSGDHANIIAGSVTGGDVAENTLAKVPNADKLDGRDSTDFVRAVGSHPISAGLPQLFDQTGCPTGLNGWGSADAADSTPMEFWRDPFGTVHIEGTVINCGTAPARIFWLPRGFRPHGIERFTAYDDTTQGPTNPAVRVGTYVEYGTNPPQGGSQTHRLFLDGISFRCYPSGQVGCP